MPSTPLPTSLNTYRTRASDAAKSHSCTAEMESDNEPKRVVLRFDVRYELEEAAINERFFALYPPEPPRDDFFSHLMAPNETSKMHIVLDIHCKSHPTIDNSNVTYEVFKVKKRDNLFVSHRYPCMSFN